MEEMLNHEAGMVALSGLPNDMRAVRKAAAGGSADAKLAVEVFTPQCAESDRRFRVADGRPGCAGLYRRHRRTRCAVAGGDLERTRILRDRA